MLLTLFIQHRTASTETFFFSICFSGLFLFFEVCCSCYLESCSVVKNQEHTKGVNKLLLQRKVLMELNVTQKTT